MSLNKDEQSQPKSYSQEHSWQGLLLGLNAELQSLVLHRCDTISLGHLERVNRHFGPPQQSMVQQAVRHKMRQQLPGASLQVRSWPTLLLQHERIHEAAKSWDGPGDDALQTLQELSEVSDDDAWVATMRMKASLTKLVAKMSQAIGHDADVVEQCATCIINSCIDFTRESHPELMESACNAVVAAGGISVLIKVLDKGPDDAKGSTAGALYEIARHGRKHDAVVAGGAVPALIKVLDQGPDHAKSNASMTLGTIARNERHVDAVVDGGAVAALIKALDQGPDDAKCNASCALGDIARHEKHVDTAMAGGAVATLLNVLDEGPDDAKNNASGTLGLMARHEKHMDAVVAGGAVAALINVLEQGPDDAKGQTAGALGRIARNKNQVDAVVAGGAVGTLIKVLDQGPDDAKESASRALGDIASNENQVNAVVAGGAVPSLIKVLDQGPDDATVPTAVILAKIALSEKHVDAVVADGGVEALINVLRQGPEVKGCAGIVSFALGNVARIQQHVDLVHQVLMREGAHARVVAALSGMLDGECGLEDPKKESAIAALAALEDLQQRTVVRD